MDTGGFTKVGEIRIRLWWVNVIALVITVPVMLLFAVAETKLHGPASPTGWDLLCFGVAYGIQLAIHELLHAVGYIGFGGLRGNELKFGINWKALAPFCNCLSPVRIDSFRRSTLLPILALFPLSLAVWLIFAQWWLALLAAATLLGGTGDVIVILKTLHYSSNLFILEHPSGIGGDVFALTDELRSQDQISPRSRTITPSDESDGAA